MDVISSSLQAFDSSNGVLTKEVDDDEDSEIPAVDSIANHSNTTTEVSSTAPCAELLPSHQPASRSISNGGRKKKRALGDVSGCSYSSSSQHKGLLLSRKRRSPKVIVGRSSRGERDLEALALPLGMSIAAVVAQVLDRKNAAEDRMSVDHLSMICTSAVRESLANVFGDKFDCFTWSFEKSFQSTLSTLRFVNEASRNMGGDLLNHFSIENHSSEVASPTSLNKKECPLSNSGINDCHSEAILPTGNQESFRTCEETPDNVRMDPMNLELTPHGQINQQMACVSPRILGSGINSSMLSTFEKSVMEQARSNDLKTFEIGLIMKRMQLKESQLALNSDSNLLERVKISMGISKASFRAEKFKNQLEDTRHAELLTKCIDCLVAGLLIMSTSLLYGAYIYSYQRITEASASCASSPQETKSWWIPKTVSFLNSGMHMLRCQALAVTRMLFGVLMILAIAYLLLQRSGTAKQTMPVTFILLLLGIVCGFMGKLCVDTLGGNGYHWLVYWEVLCLLHFFANICTSTLFLVLHGHVPVSQGAEGNVMFPYWIRRFVFYAILLLFLPMSCGLFPFAGPGDWRHHFSLLLADTLSSVTGIENLE